MFGELIILSAVLFAVGAVGFLTRRNAFVVLMSLELMLNAANVVFVAASKQWGGPEGLASVLIVIAIAAAEAAVALAALLALFRVVGTEKIDEWRALRG